MMMKVWVGPPVRNSHGAIGVKWLRKQEKMACMEWRFMENSALVEALVFGIGPLASRVTRRRDKQIYDDFGYFFEIQSVIASWYSFCNK